MKSKFTVGLMAAIAAFVALPLSGATAADKPFSLKVEGTTLHIYSPDGKEVGTGLPPATIARTVDAPPYSFQVSFGADANGNLSVIVTPNPENPTPLSFTMNNRSVQMDKSSVVTLTVGSNGVTTVDPGSTGGVRVDNHTSVAAPSVAAAGSPTQQSPDVAAAGATTDTAASNTNPSNLSAPTAPLANDPTASPSAFNNPAGMASFNASSQAVAANSPTTTPSPTTPF